MRDFEDELCLSVSVEHSWVPLQIPHFLQVLAFRNISHFFSLPPPSSFLIWMFQFPGASFSHHL